MIAWLRGWIETIRIYLFDRDTYNWLAHGVIYDEIHDFVEVDRPGST